MTENELNKLLIERAQVETEIINLNAELRMFLEGEYMASVRNNSGTLWLITDLVRQEIGKDEIIKMVRRRLLVLGARKIEILAHFKVDTE